MLVTLKKKKKKKWINQLDYIGYIPLLISGKINILIWTYCSHFYPEGTIKLLYIYIYITDLEFPCEIVPKFALKGPILQAGRLTK